MRNNRVRPRLGRATRRISRRDRCPTAQYRSTAAIRCRVRRVASRHRRRSAGDPTSAASARSGTAARSRKRRRTGLVASLLLLGGVAVARRDHRVDAARSDGFTTVAPSSGQESAWWARPRARPPQDDSPPGTPDDGGTSQDSMKTVTSDPLYATGAQTTVGCREPQVALSTQQAVKAYYANLVGCLNRTWAGKIRPPATPSRLPGCSSGPVSPGAVHRLVRRLVLLRGEPDALPEVRRRHQAVEPGRRPSNRSFARMWVTYTAGREFGHHLQQLAGILRGRAAAGVRRAGPGRAARAEPPDRAAGVLSRRGVHGGQQGPRTGSTGST